METGFRTDAAPASRAALEDQLRECYGRVVYSHKTHEKCADILQSRLGAIKVWQIALSAVTAAGCIAVVFGAGPVGAWVGALVSTSLLALNTYTKDHDLGELSQRHRQAGADLWIVREKYLSLITDLKMGTQPVETIQIARDRLLNELHAVYSGAPGTTYRAYRKAQKALAQFEDMTFSDQEIDAFLPNQLTKNSPKARARTVPADSSTRPRTKRSRRYWNRRPPDSAGGHRHGGPTVRRPARKCHPRRPGPRTEAPCTSASAKAGKPTDASNILRTADMPTAARRTQPPPAATLTMTADCR